MITISSRGSVVGDVDENAYLSDMERNCHVFFRNPHGSRETYTVHCGQLIVRSTVRFSNGPERRTSVYLYLPNGFADNPGKADTYCISWKSEPRTIYQAKRLIDEVLNTGVFDAGD